MCEHCKFEDNHGCNKTYDSKDSIQLHRYLTYDDSYSYYLVLGKGWYDEYDSYNIETKVEFCPMCGRKLGGET